MQTQIFKTTELVNEILSDCKNSAQAFQKKYGRKPALAVILVGDDPGSSIYVAKKGETCRANGIESLDFRLSASEGFAKLEALVKDLNQRQDVDGILVQSPLPKGWDEKKIQSTILPSKDVDGFHPENAGRLFLDAAETLKHGLPPCTPAGVMEILRKANLSCEGKRAVVLGRSSIVGKPMAQMLLAANATVTICHSRSQNLSEICQEADILVAAIGKAKFVDKSFVKKGATVIDVGINRLDKKVVGDVDASSLEGHAGFLTPVPNGVGPMTIAILLRNTIRAANNARQ